MYNVCVAFVLHLFKPQRTIWHCCRLYVTAGLLVDPWLGHGGVVVELFAKPQFNLFVGRVDGIAAMADVASNINTEVASDGAGLAVCGVGGSKHLAAHLYYMFALPDHCKDWSRVHVLDKTIEETFAFQISIVFLQVLL